MLDAAGGLSSGRQSGIIKTISRRMSRSKELLMSEAKRCVLYDRDCIDCGECDMCDLEPGKVCDNCGRCIHSDAEYNTVLIDQIVKPEDEQYVAEDADLGEDG